MFTCLLIYLYTLISMSDIFEITALSLQVSTIATLVSLLIGLPLGTWLALGTFRGQAFILSIINTNSTAAWCGGACRGNDPLAQRAVGKPGDHLPHRGHIVIAQTIISAPVVIGLTAAAMAALDPRLQQQLLGLGASACK